MSTITIQEKYQILKEHIELDVRQKGEKVALFGKATIEYIKGGGGSGDVNVPYIRNIYEGFCEKDVSIYMPLVEFYKDYVKRESVNIPTQAQINATWDIVNAMEFCKHIPQEEYPAGALAAAFYICSGIRGMERGTMSSVRDENGKEILADVELLRLAVPRRVFTLSQINYVIDRMTWLWDNRHLIGGLKFTYEPPVLRFFMGGLEPTSDWPSKLMDKFRKDFGDSL